eukprot:24514_1
MQTRKQTLIPARYIMNKRNKKRTKSRIKFILDPLYCKQCPGRLYKCLKEVEKIYEIQIYNGTKLLIIEYAATTEYDRSRKQCKYCWFDMKKECPFCHGRSDPNTWRRACIRCHKGGCSYCYERRHRKCQKMIMKNKQYYAGKNQQYKFRNSKNDLLVFADGIGINSIKGLKGQKVKSWAFKYGSQQEKQWKHDCWRRS